MEYIKEITIEEAVIHILDNNSQEPVLNENFLELNDETYSFLYKHIAKCFNDEELKYGKFQIEDGNVVLNLTQEYFNKERDLLSISKELTSDFFKLLKVNGDISSCDFIFAAISTEFGRFLAILKMDYTKNYIHSVDVVEGKLDIKITPQFIGLPGGSQRLRGCAFIKQSLEKNDYDLMIIDRQVEEYFSGSFIKCSIVENERDMTKNFVKAAEDWTRKNYKEKAEAAEIMRTAVKKKLKEEDTVDIDKFSKEIFLEEDKQKDFVDFVASKGVNEKVYVDREWLEKRMKRVRLKLDKDIDLYIDEETYNNDNRFEIQRNGDGTINMVIKHVTNYIEK